MTFLNGILAFGATAFVIPLVIHLLNRSRFRTVPWGAMHLLESVVRINHRRIQIEQILLLLVRCAIPVLLALCLARPVMTGWHVLPGDAPSSTVLLLDNSYSMDAASGDRTNLEEALDHAQTILGTRVRGSDVSVIRTGGGPTPVFDQPTFDVRKMSREIQHLPSGFGPSPIPDSLDSALAILGGMSQARRDVIWISDFQRSDWDAVPEEVRNRLSEQFAGMPMRPQVTWIPVGETVEENVSIDSLEFAKRAFGVGQVLHLRAHLRNHGASPYSNARILLRVDDRQVATSQVNLAPQATSQVLFTHAFATAGSHVVEIDVSVEDPVATDNRYVAAINVLDHIPVLLVDGHPSSTPLESETDFLSVALTPFTFGRVRLADLLQTKTVTTRELKDDAVAEARVIVLANVPKLDDKQVAMLTEFVSGGGGLIVFAGDRMDIDWYNKTLCCSGGLLPMPFGAMQGSSGDANQTGQPNRADPTSHIVAQHFDHPALDLFNDRANGNLSDAEIRRWYHLGAAPEASAGPSESETVSQAEGPLAICRLETGEPLMVERRVGGGVVIQVATTCDADWTNLPMRPTFVPLMQQIVATVASQVIPPNNLQPGDPLVALVPGESTGIPLSLTTPDGKRHTVRPISSGNRGVVEFHGTQQPGVYTLTAPDGLPRHYVVETSRSESDLRLPDPSDLKELASAMGADLVSTGDEFVKQDRTRRHGREVGWFLFWGVLGLMALELVLQQRFSRVRR